jgi:hypothetical protein
MTGFLLQYEQAINEAGLHIVGTDVEGSLEYLNINFLSVRCSFPN